MNGGDLQRIIGEILGRTAFGISIGATTLLVEPDPTSSESDRYEIQILRN